MKPQPDRHQSSRNQEPGAQVFVQERDEKNSAKERCHRVIRPGARCAEMA
jgi:hypothetical protein